MLGWGIASPPERSAEGGSEHHFLVMLCYCKPGEAREYSCEELLWAFT